MDYHEDSQPGDNFSEAEVNMIKDSFAYFDRDGDGTISTEEVALSLRAIGCLCTDKDVDQLIRKYDPENTQVLDLKDFINCAGELQIHNNIDNEDDIKAAFQIFDKDDNGMIKLEELRHVVNRIGDPMQHEEIEAFIQEVQGDDQVNLSMEDILKALQPQTDRGSLLTKTVD